jgi:hypothetical protein
MGPKHADELAGLCSGGGGSPLGSLENRLQFLFFPNINLNAWNTATFSYLPGYHYSIRSNSLTRLLKTPTKSILDPSRSLV